METIRRYGWSREPEDYRDHLYSTSRPLLGLPAKTDVRNELPACYDQGSTSSCTYHGTAGAIQAAQFVAGFPIVMPSRLFGYYNTRLLEGSEKVDEGAYIRDALKATNIYGIAPENLWPFDESKVLVKPPQNAYNFAHKDRIRFYASVNLKSLDAFKLPLSHGYPVIFGFDVPAAFERSRMEHTGMMEDYDWDENYIGGHCVCAVGYDDSVQMALCRNSWGTKWGFEHGHFWMPYKFLLSNHCSDGWMLRLK